MKIKLAFILSLFILFGNCVGQTGLSCTTYHDYILTHSLTAGGPVPTAFNVNGVYPYLSYSETSNRPVLKNYRFVVLENDQIKIIVCPDLGGKVYSNLREKKYCMFPM